MRLFTLLLIFVYHFLFSPIYAISEVRQSPNDDCATATLLFADQITTLLQKNEFTRFDELLSIYQAQCGETELSLRIRIIQNLIEQKNSKELIQQYLDQQLDKQLTLRQKDADQANFENIYSKNPKKYNYLPLRHPVDQIIKIKSSALLNSDIYDLNEEEELILFLFSEQSDIYQSIANEAAHQAEYEKYSEMYYYRSRYSGLLYVGVQGPLGATNPIFKTSPTIGLQLLSPIDQRMFFEFGLKVQFNTGSRNFDYLLYDDIENVKSDVSYYIGGDVGIVAYERKRFILTPKVGIGFKSVSTGLSEVTFSDFVDEYDDLGSSGIKFHNVNTMDLSFSLAGMQHIRKKNHIGLQLAYHYIPYKWDKNLLTEVFSHYTSLELLFRF